MSHWSDALRGLDACSDGIEWAATQPDAETAWRTCTRGDWMLWSLAQGLTRETPEHRTLIAACCECARLALPHVRPGELRPLRAIEAAERYARGDAISRAELRRAADDATYAADAYAAAADAAAAYAAYAAAAAAYAYATYAAASYAATANANAAATANANANAAADARASTLAQCEDIVRRHMPQMPKI